MVESVKELVLDLSLGGHHERLAGVDGLYLCADIFRPRDKTQR